MSILRRGLGGTVCWVLMMGVMTAEVVAQPKSGAGLVIDHRAFTQPQRRGSSLAIEATITSSAGIHKAEVFCRAAEAREFVALPMVHTGGNVYRAVVPDWMTAGNELEYYITATDQLGHSASQGFVGFPLSVRLVSMQRPTQEERLKSLQETLDFIRKSRQEQQSGAHRDPSQNPNP